MTSGSGAFQEACITGTVRLLEEAGLPARFERIKGKRQTYHRALLSVKGQSLEVYVYRDEAGFMVNGSEWAICERPDYDTEEALIEAFLQKLRGTIRKLQGGSGSTASF